MQFEPGKIAPRPVLATGRHWLFNHLGLFDKCSHAAAGAKKLGLKPAEEPFFDTVKLSVKDARSLCNKAVEAGVNLRELDASTVTISLDETTSLQDVDQLLYVLNSNAKPDFTAESLAAEACPSLIFPHCNEHTHWSLLLSDGKQGACHLRPGQMFMQFAVKVAQSESFEKILIVECSCTALAELLPRSDCTPFVIALLRR